jgi:hypothetical protein
MEDIQGSGGSSYGFITTNAMTFGPDLLMSAKLQFSQLPCKKWHGLGTHGPSGATTILQHPSSGPYGGYSRV